jgi:hypothetical protein
LNAGIGDRRGETALFFEKEFSRGCNFLFVVEWKPIVGVERAKVPYFAI